VITGYSLPKKAVGEGEYFLNQIKNNKFGFFTPSTPPKAVLVFPFNTNIDDVVKSLTLDKLEKYVMHIHMHRCLPIIKELHSADETVDNQGYSQKKLVPDIERICKIIRWKLEEKLQLCEEKDYQLYLQPVVSFEDLMNNEHFNKEQFNKIKITGTITESNKKFSVNFQKADNVDPATGNPLPERISPGAVIIPIKAGRKETDKNWKEIRKSANTLDEQLNAARNNALKMSRQWEDIVHNNPQSMVHYIDISADCSFHEPQSQMDYRDVSADCSFHEPQSQMDYTDISADCSFHEPQSDNELDQSFSSAIGKPQSYNELDQSFSSAIGKP